AVNGANLTPSDITENGVTLSKTAKKTSDTTWDVTLQVCGGGTRESKAPIDVILLLDCSTSMKDAAEKGGKTTRLAVARDAAMSLLDTLKKNLVNANVGIIGFSGKANVFFPLTPLLQEKDGTFAVHKENYNLMKYHLKNTWGPSNEVDNGTYGVQGGTNLERAMAAGEAALQTATSGTKYVILLSDGEPTVYGEKEFCSNREKLYQMSDEDIAQNTQEAAQKILAKGSATRQFAVGFDVGNMQHYASENSAFRASAKNINAVFEEIATTITQTVQNGSVRDTIGTRFAYVDGSAKIAPIAVGEGETQPSIAPQNEGKELAWNLGAWLEKGKPATLTYTLCLNDPLLEGAGAVVPLNQNAIFTWSALTDGGGKECALDFPAPTDVYEAGTLHVFSSGLPQGISGTTQDIEKTLVTKEAHFTVKKPMDAPQNIKLIGVRVNDIACTLAEFEAQYAYQMPVTAGETKVEYCYQMDEVPPTEWTYHVEYYVNEVPKPEWNYTGTVPADSPIVTSVDNNLANLPDYYETSHTVFPYTLQANGEVIPVYYVAIPLPNAQLAVNNVYHLNDTVTEGTRTTTPAVAKGTVAVGTLLEPVFNSKTYTSTDITLVRTELPIEPPTPPVPQIEKSASAPTGASAPALESALVNAGTFVGESEAAPLQTEDATAEPLPLANAQEITQILQPDSTFQYEDGYRYALNLQYNRTETPPPPTPDPPTPPTPTPPTPPPPTPPPPTPTPTPPPTPTPTPPPTPNPTPIVPTGTLPRTSGTTVFGNIACGIAAAWFGFALHRKYKIK
ncbi:MAG: vWA domain-containing protein, partial [Ruthenibacterium sp.]